ncbi:MAG TPA: anti-sigma factor [Actinomycetota bacterium]
MTEPHDEIEELLAGYVLRGLSGPDAARADALLSDHVPTCAACRDSLTRFQGITAELAFAADPLPPPDLLLTRLHRELRPRSRRQGPARIFAVAAGFIVVAGLTGLTVSQGMRAGGLQERANHLSSMLDLASRPDAEVTSLAGTGSPAPLTEISAPGTEVFYLFGRDVPPPPAGQVYRVWLVAGDASTPVGEFRPDDGLVAIRLAFDPTRYDEILITVEPEASEPGDPADVVWRAAS